MKAKLEHYSFGVEILETRRLFSGANDLAHSTTDLSAGRYFIGAVTLNNQAVFAGGYSNALGLTARERVDIYDGATGSWRTTNTPGLESTAPTAVFRSKALFVGEGNVVYDAKTKIWKNFKLPESISTDRSIAVLGDRVLILGLGGSQFNKDLKFLSDSSLTHWHAVNVPLSYNPGQPAYVGSKVYFLQENFVYDVRTRQWSTVPHPVGVQASGAATTVGTKVLYADRTGEVTIFDTVTSQWSTKQLAVARPTSATTVGTKAIFAGGGTEFPNSPQSDAVDIYDASTDEWSSTTLSMARGAIAATTVGNKAIFAGGSTQRIPAGLVPDYTAQSAVDIFTDTHPSAVLSGDVNGKISHTVQVKVINSGDANLDAGYTVQLYASSDRTLNNAILVGNRKLSSPLAAGSSSRVNIQTKIPKGAAAGVYYLLAAIKDPTGNITPIAVEDATFRVRASSALPAAHRNVAGTFSNVRIGAFTGMHHAEIF